MSTPATQVKLLIEAALFHWRLLVLPTVLAGVVAFAGFDRVPREYRAGAKILIQESATVNPFLEEMAVQWTLKKRMPVIQSVLRSHNTLRAVLERLDRIGPEDSPEEVDNKVRAFSRTLNVYSSGRGMVSIGLRGATPDEVHEGMQVLVETFIEEMLRPQKEGVQRSTEFLEAQLDRVRAELTTVEDELREFKRANIDELPEVYKINLRTLLELRKELGEAQLEFQSELRRRQLSQDRLSRMNPVAQRLEAEHAEARGALESLRAVYTDKHPEVRAARARVRELSRALKETRRGSPKLSLSQLEALARGGSTGSRGDEPEAMVSVDPLTSDILQFKRASANVEGSRARISALENQLGAATNSIRGYADNEQTLNRFLRDLEVKARVYEDLLAKYEDALVTRELALLDESAQVWVIEPPRRPTRPDGMGRLLFTLVALIGGFACGAALAFVRESLSSGIRDADVAADKIGAPLLGTIPRFDERLP